ncbi:MAG: PepSY-associated TM helix domain-containing protein [Pseudomonadota bacterium]
MRSWSTARRRFRNGVLATFAILLASLTSLSTWADTRDQAKRIYDRIAGVPPDEATITAMADLLDNGNQTDAVAAAMMATEADEFYTVTLKNFAAPWTNRDQSVFVPLNDYTATVVGMVRDNYDFREILRADVICVGRNTSPGYSRTSNAHYEALERSGASLKDELDCTTPQSSLTGVPATATAGVMTTRAAAKAFFIDGTNRAMFRFTLMNHMCNDLEQVKDVTRVPDRIRQDVSRSPGGDSRLFLNGCIGCHSGMDPLAGAYAYYDYAYDVDADPDGESGQIVYTDGAVASKYFNNDNNFEHGFITTDDSWLNYWRDGQNALLGWNTSLPASGNGAKSMGWELSNSDAFAQCQVEKVFENVCLHPVEDDADRAQITSMVSSFRANNYNLKQVYAESALYCKGL